MTDRQGVRPALSRLAFARFLLAALSGRDAAAARVLRRALRRAQGGPSGRGSIHNDLGIFYMQWAEKETADLAAVAGGPLGRVAVGAFRTAFDVVARGTPAARADEAPEPPRGIPSSGDVLMALSAGDARVLHRKAEAAAVLAALAHLHLSRAAELEPGNPNPLVSLSRLHGRTLGDLDAALRHAEEALARDPARATARSNLGIAREALGDLDGARADYRAAVDLDPSCMEAHFNLGTLELRHGDAREAVVSLGAALLLAPRDREVREAFEQAVTRAGGGASRPAGRLEDLVPAESRRRIGRARKDEAVAGGGTPDVPAAGRGFWGATLASALGALGMHLALPAGVVLSTGEMLLIGAYLFVFGLLSGPMMLHRRHRVFSVGFLSNSLLGMGMFLPVVWYLVHGHPELADQSSFGLEWRWHHPIALAGLAFYPVMRLGQAVASMQRLASARSHGRFSAASALVQRLRVAYPEVFGIDLVRQPPEEAVARLQADSRYRFAREAFRLAHEEALRSGHAANASIALRELARLDVEARNVADGAASTAEAVAFLERQMAEGLVDPGTMRGLLGDCYLYRAVHRFQAGDGPQAIGPDLDRAAAIFREVGDEPGTRIAEQVRAGAG